MKDIYLLDAKAKQGSEAVTAVSDAEEDLIKDFLQWTIDRKITNETLEYAGIFKKISRHKGKIISYLSLLTDGSCLIDTVERNK